MRPALTGTPSHALFPRASETVASLEPYAIPTLCTNIAPTHAASFAKRT